MRRHSSLLTASIEPESPRSQSERAYLGIREKIVTLEMPPGSIVREAALREQLQVGRTPIREALRQLAQESLVTVIPHRGTFVSEINITDLGRITEVRVELEGYAARLAAERANDSDREAMGRLLAELDSGEVAEPGDLMHLDHQIHRQLYRATRNSFLESTLDRYFSLSLRLWFLALDHQVRLREAVEEHRELLKAVMAGDGGAAEDIMRRHVVGFECEIRKVL